MVLDTDDRRCFFFDDWCYRNNYDMEKVVDTDEIKKVRWTTGEVAELIGESASKVRFWCKYFSLKPSRHGDKRRFNQAELDVIKRIQSLISEGYRLKFIKKKL